VGVGEFGAVQPISRPMRESSDAFLHRLGRPKRRGRFDDLHSPPWIPPSPPLREGGEFGAVQSISRPMTESSDAFLHRLGRRESARRDQKRLMIPSMRPFRRLKFSSIHWGKTP